jgi:hypothetical protein
MATPARDLEHYHLPARIRTGKVSADSFSCRLALADRIADLPGIDVVEESRDTLPWRVKVYLRAPSTSDRRQHQALPFCTISRDSIAIHGLSEWGRHQVLRGGWGKLRQDYVSMFLPRNTEELEVCWDVLQCAFSNLSTALAKTPLVRQASWLDLPRFSRTTLQ